MWVKLREKFKNRSIINAVGFEITGNMLVKLPGDMPESSISPDMFERFETREDAEKGITIEQRMNERKPKDVPKDVPKAEPPKVEAKPAPVIETPMSKPARIYTKAELELKSQNMTFFQFRDWARTEFKITNRSITGLIMDILDIQSGKKKAEIA